MPYCRYRSACLWLIGLLTAIFAASIAAPAAAQEWTPFMASGVAVDVTAGSASEARDRALAQGQLLAFDAMLRKLTDPADYGRLPPADPATVSNMVVGFEVEEEKASAVRYVATLTYRFDVDSVRSLLQNLIGPQSRVIHRIRMHRIHTNTTGSQLQGRDSCHLGESGLGGRIGRSTRTGGRDILGGDDHYRWIESIFQKGQAGSHDSHVRA